LDLFDGVIASVRDASRATLHAAAHAIEGLVRTCFVEHVTEAYGSNVKSIDRALRGSPEAEQHRIAYDGYREGGAEPTAALARALIDGAFAKPRLREAPIGTLIELGRRAGFLSPWHNQGRGGKLQKRYNASAEFLEILIAATVEPNEPLEFPEFLDRLRESFGIVVGRPQDDQAIRQNNLKPVAFGAVTAFNEEDLRRNVEEMRRLIVETGYARAYADGRTIVTTNPEQVR
jgi:hypothetical protein